MVALAFGYITSDCISHGYISFWFHKVLITLGQVALVFITLILIALVMGKLVVVTLLIVEGFTGFEA